MEIKINMIRSSTKPELNLDFKSDAGAKPSKTDKLKGALIPRLTA